MVRVNPRRSYTVVAWGEFLTREQALAVIGWLTVLVASEATDA